MHEMGYKNQNSFSWALRKAILISPNYWDHGYCIPTILTSNRRKECFPFPLFPLSLTTQNSNINTGTREAEVSAEHNKLFSPSGSNMVKNAENWKIMGLGGFPPFFCLLGFFLRGVLLFEGIF